MPVVPQDTSEIKTNQTSLFLFVGPADSGKSYAASSFGLKSKAHGIANQPEGHDPRFAYMLELDGRLSALKGRPIKFNSYNNIEGATAVLNRIIELRESCVRANAAPFHTLILDSATSFGDMSVADSLDVTVKTGEGGRKRGELAMLTIQDYGFEAEAMRQLVWENLLDIKRFADVIVIAHEVKLYKNAKTKPGEPSRSEWDGESYQLLMHGTKIAERLPTKFDEVYHFAAKEVIPSSRSIRRKVRFNDILARSSYPELQSTDWVEISGKEFYPFWKGLTKQ